MTLWQSASNRPQTDIPPLASADLGAMFLAGLAALALFWVPVTLLRQVDAFLAFMTGTDLIRDLSVAGWLVAVPALGLALLGAGVGRIYGRLRGWQQDDPSVQRLRWLVALLPTLWLCIWQFAGGAWVWFKTVSGHDLSIGSSGRVIAALVMFGLLLVAGRRGALHALLERLIPALLSLRRLIVGLMVAAGIFVALNPPRNASAHLVQAAPPATAGRPDIYLITIDTLATQDATVCGEGPTLMPRLRALAQMGTCFTDLYASANFTTPSTITIETGALPWTHWGVQIVAKLAPSFQRESLANRLAEVGYQTHSISANLLASPRHHGTFDGYDSQSIAASTSLGIKPRQALTWLPDTTLPFWLSSIVPFLDTIDVYTHGEENAFKPEYAYAQMQRELAAADQTKPQFFWVHTLPPHDPYLPPQETKYTLLPRGELERWSQMLGMGNYPPQHQGLIDKHRLRYRESIMGADLALGRLLDELQRDGRLDKALIIVSSDHGESFERGFIGHAGDLIHNAVLRVPLVIKVPGQQAGRIVSTPVSLADLAPTVVDYAGARALPSHDGRSLRTALEGHALPARPVYSMAMERQSRFAPLRQGHYAVIDGHFKLVLHLATQETELYELDRDPLELHDMTSQMPERTAQLKALLLARLNEAETRRQQMFGGR